MRSGAGTRFTLVIGGNFFYDRCCSPIADGTASFFTEDIVKFKDNFFHIPGESELKELFSRSLGGEIIIDYYSDDPKLNMLQSDTADVFAEKRFAFTDRTYELENAYHFESFIRVVKTVMLAPTHIVIQK